MWYTSRANNARLWLRSGKHALSSDTKYHRRLIFRPTLRSTDSANEEPCGFFSVFKLIEIYDKCKCFNMSESSRVNNKRFNEAPKFSWILWCKSRSLRRAWKDVQSYYIWTEVWKSSYLHNLTFHQFQCISKLKTQLEVCEKTFINFIRWAAQKKNNQIVYITNRTSKVPR